MVGRMMRELKQNKPIAILEEEAYLNVARTANLLEQPLAELLKRHELTHTQYNVLRILRGAGPDGLTAGDIGDRMITRDPDVTRLLDRLEKRGLVERWRCRDDRRVVWTRITEGGLAAIAPLDELLRETHERLLGHLGRDRLMALIGILEELRAGLPE